MKINNLISEISNKLSSTNDAWVLVEAITNKTKIQLISEQFIELTDLQKATIDNWVYRIINEHFPIQYLIGNVPFIDLKIFVEPPILIPRPETEHWVYELIQKLKNLKNKNITILDIGTGSGCIALSLAKALPEAQIYAIDISDKVIELATKNAVYNNMKNIKIIKSDLFQAISDKKFDLIVSNPPYIDEKLLDTLQPSVKDWEDPKALVTSDKGLYIIKKIINEAPNFLTSNNELKAQNIPRLVIEIDYTHKLFLLDFLKNTSFKSLNIQKDLTGLDRILEIYS